MRRAERTDQQLAALQTFGIRSKCPNPGDRRVTAQYRPVSTTALASCRPRSARRLRRAALPRGLRWLGGALAAALLACGPSYPETEYPSAPPAGVSKSPDDFAPAPPG